MKIKPMKTRIVEVFKNGELLNAKAIHEIVLYDYPSERYCSIKTIEDHLKSLKAVGILNEEGSYIDDDGNLVSTYRISEYGLDKLHKAS